MTIEALLSSIDQKLGQLIALAGSQPDIPAASQQNIAAGEAAVAAAGAAVTSPVAEAPAKRGRGRPAKGETAAAPAATETPAPVVTQPVVQEANDFLSIGEEKQPEIVVDLNAVRAALAVYATKNDQGKAVALLKESSGGAETLQQLQAKPDKFGSVFKAAIPSGKLSLDDVRAVLVAANARIANGGFNVLKEKGGTAQLKDLAEDKFVAVINAASAVK